MEGQTGTDTWERESWSLRLGGVEEDEVRVGTLALSRSASRMETALQTDTV